MLCDRPGRALAVSVNPDQSLPPLDAQRHQRASKVTECAQARPDVTSREVSAAAVQRLSVILDSHMLGLEIRSIGATWKK